MVESARAKGTLARGIAQAIRAPVSVPADLVHSLEAGLIKRICQLLGFARRAGQAVAGFEKVREWLRAGDVGLVVQASDGSPEECSRLMAEVRAEGGRGPEHLLPVLAPLGAAEMGRIFGRREVFEVAIAPGRLTNKLVNETERLSGIAGSTMVQWVGAAGANRKIKRTSND